MAYVMVLLAGIALASMVAYFWMRLISRAFSEVYQAEQENARLRTMHDSTHAGYGLDRLPESIQEEMRVACSLFTALHPAAISALEELRSKVAAGLYSKVMGPGYYSSLTFLALEARGKISAARHSLETLAKHIETYDPNKPEVFVRFLEEAVTVLRQPQPSGAYQPIELLALMGRLEEALAKMHKLIEEGKNTQALKLGEALTNSAAASLQEDQNPES